MEFVWDEPKRRITLKERGLDFGDAYKVFSGATFTFEDDRFNYGEKRFVTLGLLKGEVVVIVHTETIKQIRIISRRKGVKDEQKIYFHNV